MLQYVYQPSVKDLFVCIFNVQEMEGPTSVDVNIHNSRAVMTRDNVNSATLTASYVT
jgi:hypothetical protein